MLILPAAVPVHERSDRVHPNVTASVAVTVVAGATATEIRSGPTTLLSTSENAVGDIPEASNANACVDPSVRSAVLPILICLYRVNNRNHSSFPDNRQAFSKYRANTLKPNLGNLCIRLIIKPSAFHEKLDFLSNENNKNNFVDTVACRHHDAEHGGCTGGDCG